MRIGCTSLALILALGGCATAPKMTYIRTDGQHIKGDAVREQQFQVDAAICNGEMQKANVSGVTFTGGGIAGAVAAANRSSAVGQVGQGCMAEKGYVIVPEEQAEAKLAEFAAIAEEKKQREAAEEAAAHQLPAKKRQSAAVHPAAQ